MKREKKEFTVWWKNFDNLEDALTELLFSGLSTHDFKNDLERLKAWQYNREKFSSEIENSRQDAEKNKSGWLFDASYWFETEIKILKNNINCKTIENHGDNMRRLTAKD